MPTLLKRTRDYHRERPPDGRRRTSSKANATVSSRAGMHVSANEDQEGGGQLSSSRVESRSRPADVRPQGYSLDTLLIISGLEHALMNENDTADVSEPSETAAAQSSSVDAFNGMREDLSVASTLCKEACTSNAARDIGELLAEELSAAFVEQQDGAHHDTSEQASEPWIAEALRWQPATSTAVPTSTLQMCHTWLPVAWPHAAWQPKVFQPSQPAPWLVV